jgi:O-methyltransferase
MEHDMFVAFRKVLKDPGVLVRVFRVQGRNAYLRLLQKLSYKLQQSPFFLQGQMDVHSNARWGSEDFREETGAFYPRGSREGREIRQLEPWDNTRRDMLVLLLRTIEEKQLDGDFAELGVYQGSTASLIHHYAPERKLHLFDTFEGFTDRGVVAENSYTGFSVRGSHFSDTSLDAVKSRIKSTNENVMYYKGYFPETVPDRLKQGAFCFVHLDADLYESTLSGLAFFYPRMVSKGVIVVHDYNAWIGARKAVDDFFRDRPELPIPMPDKSGSVVIVKH